MCDPSELKKLPNPPRLVPAAGVAGLFEVDEPGELELLESEEPKNDRVPWYPLLDPPDPLPLLQAGAAGSTGAPLSARWHRSLGIIE